MGKKYIKKITATVILTIFLTTMQVIGAESNKTGNKNMKNLINQNRLVETFIRYVKYDTGSNAQQAEEQIPSTEKQKKLAVKLAQELKEIGLENINIDKHSIVTGELVTNSKEEMPIIGLFAHIDTSSDVPTGPVKPQIHEYKGDNIILNDETVISAEDLKNEIGNTIITSDGTTLLGADDKSGIAEIMEALKVLVENPDIKRPTVKVVFTPDEETGMGIRVFDTEKFKADAAYTIDGGSPSEIDTETFNAFNPEITIKGKAVHCGYAYKKMINSIELANEFISKLPKNETPSTTKGTEGYYYIDEIEGTAEKTRIKMLVRDFELDNAKKRIEFLKETLREIENKNKGSEIKLEPKQGYMNIKEKLKEFPEVVQYAEEGIRRSGLKPKKNSVRGGTDGSTLTLKGLLTPNLGAGGNNFHSKEEFVSAQTMVKCCENILNILDIWVEKSPEVMVKVKQRRRN